MSAPPGNFSTEAIERLVMKISEYAASQSEEINHDINVFIGSVCRCPDTNKQYSERHC